MNPENVSDSVNDLRGMLPTAQAEPIQLISDASHEEQQFIDQFNAIIPADRYKNLTIIWLRALEAYGTPSSFLEGLKFKLDTFRMLGMEYQGYAREGGNYELRRELIAKQAPYNSLTDLDTPPYRIARSCVLCENVLQTIDGHEFPGQVKSNLIFDLGDYVVTPNRYPAFPLHMLWLPKDHDDFASRAQSVKLDIEGKEVTSIPPQAGKTRGALVEAKDLEALTSFCDEWGLIAVRNHVLSGMTIGEHDHWHLIPESCFPSGWFSGIADPASSTQDVLHRAKGTPFDILVINNRDRKQFSEKLAEVLNTLEHDNQVFSPTYIPGKNSFALVSALKAEAVADRFVQIGGALQAHEIASSNADLIKLLERCAPKRDEFDWSRYTFDDKLTPALNYTKEEIAEIHKPIDYSVMRNWGQGELVLDRLSSLCQEMYHATFSMQDKRDDPGHIDTVLHFTLLIADYMKLAELEKEAAVLVAIFHDVGWASVPNINTIWNDLATRFHSNDAATKAQAQREMQELRKFHQDVSAKSARELIGDHPYLEEICAVVNDHDTRREVHPEFFRAFFDGDWMWRVTRTSRYAQSSGRYDRTDYNAVNSSLEREIKPRDFTLPWAYHIARIELENTMRFMAGEYGWKLSKNA